MTKNVIAPMGVTKKLVAGQYMVLASVPVGKESATVNARIVSLNLAADVKVRMAIVPIAWADGSSVAPSDDQWIQPVDLILGPNGIHNGIMEDTGIVLLPGTALVAYSNTGLATGRAHGFMRSIEA